MITYVGTSSLVKLVVDEDGSDRVELLWGSADALVAASLVVVESRAALAAAERGSRLTAPQHRTAKRALADLVGELAIVEVTDALVTEAADLAEQESLRAYDAVHLAAALLIGADVLTSADSALCEAAARRGLHIANPLDP